MERGDLAEFGKKNATQMTIFLPIENVDRKITSHLFIARSIDQLIVSPQTDLSTIIMPISVPVSRTVKFNRVHFHSIPHPVTHSIPSCTQG